MNKRYAAWQQGVTLVELMVSLVIGLVIMLAVSQAYLSASSSSRLADTQARMNEDAQAALNILVQQLKLAGANPVRADRAAGSVRNSATATYIVRGCDAAFSSSSPYAKSINDLVCSSTAASTGPDALAISYEADIYNSVKNSSAVPTDCVGSGLQSSTFSYVTTAGISTQSVMYVASPVYYIDTSNDPKTLSCFNADGTRSPQPLIENVIDVQVTYGTATNTSPTSVLGYLTAHQINDPAGLVSGATLSDRWERVRTVRICILMSSSESVATSANAAQYRNCSGTVVHNPPDLKLRRAYTTTVVLRNRPQ